MQEYGIMSKIAQGNQKGFTFIEIMIAALILLTGILGIAKMQITAIKGNSYSIGLTEAATFAQNKVEELVALAYDDVDLDDDDGDGTNQDTDNTGIDDDEEGNPVDGVTNFGLDDIFTPDGSQQAVGATNIQYDILWNIAVDKPAANAKHIRVNVLWQTKGVIRIASLDRIKANF
jgi:prepilin-type N-terminal cleavage/methylation domain-containing protein